jgi:proliferating cell nuclear antigen PCNA
MYITEKSATPSLLTFEFGDDDQYSTWQVKLLDISHDPDLSIPECDYKVHVEMDADIFDKAVSMCQKVSSESGTINLSTISNTKEPEFRIDAVSDDLKSGGFVFKDTQNRKSDTDDEMVVVKIKSNIELGFAGTYMSVFSKMQVLSERVNLYIGDDVPAKLVYDLNGMGSITFHIAPKISEEI